MTWNPIWRAWWSVAVVIGIACMAPIAALGESRDVTDEMTVLVGPVQMWTSGKDVFVLLRDEQPEAKEHLFVLQRSSEFTIKRNYDRARVTFRPNRLEVTDVESEEVWILRLVPVEMLSMPPQEPAAGRPGLLVGYGLSHHEQPLTTNSAALEIRAVGGLLFQQNDSTGTPGGDCTSGGFGASSCRISCGGGRECEVTCSFGYACCKCDGDTEPSCRCKTS